MTDVAKSKRNEVEENLSNKKRKTGDNHGGFFLEEVGIQAEGKKTWEEKWSENFHNNIQQLIARNNPQMSEEQIEWLRRYNKWVYRPRLYNVWADKPKFNNESADEPKLNIQKDKFDGGDPPLSESGDPVARAQVESRNKKPFRPFVLRVAEMAIQFYNKNHKGSDFEVVEILSASEIYNIHPWVHINFKAKPKNASDEERSFFAEHFWDDFCSTNHGRRLKITDGIIVTCCLLEEGSYTNNCCGFCTTMPELLHPLNSGFLLHRSLTFKIQELAEVTESPKIITLLTNHFKVSTSRAGGHFHHYSVSITNEDGTPVVAKGLGRKILEKVRQLYKIEMANQDFAYDGEKSLFTLGPLPQAKLEFEVILEDLSSNKAIKTGSATAEGSDQKRSLRQPWSKPFLVAISFASKIPVSAIKGAFDWSESEEATVRVLDVILRQNAAKKGCLLVRQSFFLNDAKKDFDLTGGVVGCRGFHSSFRAINGGLYLNMDVSTTVIVKPGPVIDFLLENQEVEQPHMINWDKAKRILKGLRIKATNTNLEHKITGLSDQICRQQKFSMKQKTGSTEGEEVEITVFKYFVKHRKIPLKYSMDFPCINVGKPKSPVFIPIELCSLVPLQRYTKALSTQQRSFLVEKSRQKPQEMMEALTNALKNCQLNDDALIRSTGISVTGEFMRVEGYVVTPPELKVGNGLHLVPRDGRWNYNNKKLVEPVKIHGWVVVNFSAPCDLKILCSSLVRCGQKLGILIDEPSVMIKEDPNFKLSPAPTRVEEMIAMVTQKFSGRPQFILCVLPDRKNSDLYGPWKRKTLSDIGIITQCVAGTAYFNDQYLTNLLLKINIKLGGLNSEIRGIRGTVLRLTAEQPTMLVGMDVCHGSPGRSDVPSVVAVVGSTKLSPWSRYHAVVRTQSPRLEIIDSLFKKVSDTKDAGIFVELLMEFQKSTGIFPQRIIIFRDGVSETQFNQVLDTELNQIIQACKFLHRHYDPEMMVVVAQKKHNTKFFQINSPENVPPGTVIDNGVCYPRGKDFYMCAQNAMIGTTRATHYHVLYENFWAHPVLLQQLVNALSYVCQRSTTAISVVAPIYYAHLAASQMSQLIKFDEVSEQFLSQGGDVSTVPELPRLHDDVKGSMFFC